jgi:hypothetical protein
VNGWVGNDSLTPFGTFIIYTDSNKRLILRLFYGFFKPKFAKCARNSRERAPTQNFTDIRKNIMEGPNKQIKWSDGVDYHLCRAQSSRSDNTRNSNRNSHIISVSMIIIFLILLLLTLLHVNN